MTETTNNARVDRVKLNKEQRSEEELDLGYLLAIFIDHKFFIFTVTLLVTLLGYAIVWMSTPIYRADALIQVEQRGGNLASIDTSILQEQTASTTQSEILRSRMIMGQAALQAGLDLVVRPNYLPIIGAPLVRRGTTRPGWEQGSEHAWAGDTISVEQLRVDNSLLGAEIQLEIADQNTFKVITGNGQLLGTGEVGVLFVSDAPFVELFVSRINAPSKVRYTVSKRSDVQMTQYLQRRFSVSQRGTSGILELNLSGPDRQELVRSLDAIANVYLVQNINRQAAEAESRLEFLEQQTPLIQDGLYAAENRLNEYQASQDSVDLSFETRTMLERLVSIESELNQLQLQESELSRRFTPSHPNYKALLDKRSQLEREGDLLEEQVDSLPETQRQVLRMNRDVQVSQQIYMQMLNATQELQIARAGTVGNVRILDEALAGTAAIAPRTNLIMLIAVFSGLMLGVLLVLVRHLLHRGITSVEELQALGLQVYATIPLSEKQVEVFGKTNDSATTRVSVLNKGKSSRRKKDSGPSDGVLALLAPTDMAVEALRGLRTSLHFAMSEAPNNRLMLTGPSPAVGKSFVSTNLAAVCAQSGQKILLIDADMRKGRIHAAFSAQSKTGLSEHLVGDVSLDDIIRETPQEGLSYIARGIAPPNPSELLMSNKFEEFLSAVSEKFDLVIIDTPPVLAVTDAVLVGKKVGITLMITRFRENNSKEIDRSLQHLETAGINVRGCILNAIERSATSYYGYGYGYYNYAYLSEKD